MAVSRTIGKMDTVLSYVGGLFGLIFTAIAFFVGSYSEMKYELYVAESILKVDEGGKRIGESDFGFVTYLAYCCYDWLDTFGLAPRCLERLGTMHEVREEVCRQLDPTIILKRIKYLEDVSKVLLNEHRELTLYLSEPLTLQQARRMRNALTFYDRALSEIGEAAVENSVRDEKYCNPSSSGNAVGNSDFIDESKKDLTEEEEEEMFQALMVEAVAQVEKDKSEMGNKIKGRIGKRAREWFKEMKNQKEMVAVEYGGDIMSPMSPSCEVSNESGHNLKREGAKMIMKRQKQ
jgi:hypothetical protein